MKTCIIINPKAGNGRALKEWTIISKKCAFLKPYEEKVSQRAGHIIDLTREALKKGIEKIVIVGGDGSLAEAVNGFFENQKPINPNAVLGGLPLGSGSDFLRQFGIVSVDIALDRIKRNHVISCDIGEVLYSKSVIPANAGIHSRSKMDPPVKPGDDKRRLFLNISSFGCAGEIVNRVNRSKKPLGPTITYFGTMLFTFLTYKSPMVELTVGHPREGGDPEKKVFHINNVFICNGKYSGSGMMWGPKASINDGLFDVTVVTDVSKFSGILNMPKIYQGKVLELEGVESFRCHTLKATSKRDVFFEVDGEVLGTLPITFQIFSHKIKMIH